MVRRLIAALSALAVLMGSAPSFAGSQPAAAERAPPSRAEVQAAREMLSALNFEAQMELIMRGLFTPMVDAEARHYTGITTAQRQAITESAMDGMRAIMPELMEGMAVVYAEAFTIEEMHAIRDFYRSPAGQAVLERMPMLAERAGPVVQPLIPRMQEEMRSSLCRRLDCSRLERSRTTS